MNKKVFNFICKLQGFLTAVKSLHWDAKNLSQHKLCDDISDRIAEFQDQVSEVEQSISGKLPINRLRATDYKISTLKVFVEDVIKDATSFLKSMKSAGDKYIGMRSDCESFISDMQRNLYLVNFTLKEEMKRRIASRINEARHKNIATADDIEKFIGREPTTLKTRINRIYKLTSDIYGIDKRRYHDENWEAVSLYHKAIASFSWVNDVDIYPCANLNKPEWDIQGDGGYTDYDESDNMPRSKQYKIVITCADGMKIEGYIKCMAAGTVEDPFSVYDTCMVLWPKSSSLSESRQTNNRRFNKLVNETVDDVISKYRRRRLGY